MTRKEPEIKKLQEKILAAFCYISEKSASIRVETKKRKGNTYEKIIFMLAVLCASCSLRTIACA